MDNICSKIFIFAFMCAIRGSDALQTLTDLKNALQRNPLLLPSNQPAPPHAAAASPHAATASPHNPITPCTCAVFLSGQFTKGSSEPPRGNPALLNEHTKAYPCTPIGAKQCQNKCLETIIKHLPNSAEILCATIDRDCHKERAYLFVKNCNSTWQNSNLSAGREYCCKDNLPYTCPLL